MEVILISAISEISFSFMAVIVKQVVRCMPIWLSAFFCPWSFGIEFWKELNEAAPHAKAQYKNKNQEGHDQNFSSKVSRLTAEECADPRRDQQTAEYSGYVNSG